MFQVWTSSLLCVVLWHPAAGGPDWMLEDLDTMPEVTLTDCMVNDLPCVEMSNSLISRKWLLSPNWVTVELNSYLQSPPVMAVRSLQREATVGINGVDYWVGGVQYVDTAGLNYTHDWVNEGWLTASQLTVNESLQWRFVNYSVSKTLSIPYEWTPGTRHSPKSMNWPPKGLEMKVIFEKPRMASLHRGGRFRKARRSGEYPMYVYDSVVTTLHSLSLY